MSHTRTTLELWSLQREKVMERFNNILVVVDEKTENRAVIERAVTLAQRNRVRLTVVNIVKELPRPTPMAEVDEALWEIDIFEAWPPDAGRPSVPVVPGDRQEAGMPVPEAAVMIREQIVDEESQLLERWVDFVRERGVAVEGRMLSGTPFLEIIASWKELSEQTMRFFSDPASVEFIMVTIPEALGVYQSHRVIGELAEHGLDVGYMIVNDVIVDVDCDFLRQRFEMQRPYIKMLEEECSQGMTLIKLPLLPYEVKGVERLAEVEGFLFGGEG